MGTLENKINRIFEIFGLEVKRTRTCPSLRTLLRRFFKRHQVDCVLDVGANTGGYAEFLRDEVRYKGMIISFEPVSEVFRTLQQKVKSDSKWAAFQIALGPEERRQEINVCKDTSFCSFLKPAHQSETWFAGQNEISCAEDVHVRRLDQVFEELKSKHGFRSPFLKIDTQGYDREVLLGCESVLRQVVGLQSEISLLPIYEKMPGIADLFPLISSLGFDLVGTFPVNLASAGRWIESDCVFVQRNAQESKT